MFDLAPAQRRALAATARGEVKRTYRQRENVITSPKVGSKAFWKILKDKLIEEGPRDGKVVTMALTLAGEQALQATRGEEGYTRRPRARANSGA
jgi:hypothetical protein